MDRSRNLVVVAHCILNGNAKVGGICTYKGAMREIVTSLMGRDIAIFQLPCPEMQVLGCRRWGHVKEQLDTPFFRDACQKMLKDSVMQIQDYCANGYRVLGVIGIDGSPSCGVRSTCSSPRWQGDFIDAEETQGRIGSLKMISGQGVFIEELASMLSNAGLEIPFTAVDEGDPLGDLKTFHGWLDGIDI